MFCITDVYLKKLLTNNSRNRWTWYPSDRYSTFRWNIRFADQVFIFFCRSYIGFQDRIFDLQMELLIQSVDWIFYLHIKYLNSRQNNWAADRLFNLEILIPNADRILDLERLIRSRDSDSMCWLNIPSTDRIQFIWYFLFDLDRLLASIDYYIIN